MAKVVLENVNKIYDKDVHAVKDVSLSINDKEFMVFVGPSGCGKSTILRMIAGLEDVSSGIIKIGDKIVNDILPKDRDIAMVFQNYALYPHMTVYENLAFGLKLRKFKKSEIKERVDEAATILGIYDLLNRKPKQLSGGQRQRVAVGRAIVRHPKVFLFDEPLSNLDAKLRVQMREEISRLHSKLMTTMIYVTHDQIEAMTMGDRITVIKDGIVQQVDTPLNLYDNPTNKFVAGFIGSPAMNFFLGKIIKKDNLLFFEAKNMEVPIIEQYSHVLKEYVNKSIYLGVRPEHILKSDRLYINAKVEVVEPMGSEVYVYCSIDNNKFMVKLITRDIPTVGESLSFDMDQKYLHFFDVESEESVTFNLFKEKK